jgi:hypothetical protein
VSFKKPVIVVGIVLGILLALSLLATYMSGTPTDVYSEIG